MRSIARTGDLLDRPEWIWPWTATVLVASGFLGFWITREPSFLHLDSALTGRSLVLLFAALGLAAVVVRYPGVGLVLLVTAVYLNLSQVLVREHGFPSLLQLLALPLLLAAWLERTHDRNGTPGLPGFRGHHVLMGLLCLHVLAVLLSTTVATDRALADERLQETLKGLVLAVILILLITSRGRMRWAAWSLLAAGTLLGGLSLLQTATGDFGNDFGGLARIKHAHIHGNVFQPRIAGPLGDPNYFAQILLILVPLALFMGWKESGIRLRTLAFLAAGVITGATVLTYSRGGALALACVLVLVFLIRGVNLIRLAAGGLVVVAVVWLLPQDFTHRLATVVEIVPGQEEEVLERDSSFEERLLLGGVAWEMFRDRPVLGVGAANYTVHFDDYVDRVGSEAREYTSTDGTRYPHNLYLELGAEGGVIALLSFLMVMGASLALLHRARQRFLAAGDPFFAGLAAGLALAIVGYLLSSLFLHGHFQRYLWLLVGLGAALYALSPTPTSEPLKVTHGRND
jgi:putative inorganic carbon (hco3(-)) transporter